MTHIEIPDDEGNCPCVQEYTSAVGDPAWEIDPDCRCPCHLSDAEAGEDYL